MQDLDIRTQVHGITIDAEVSKDIDDAIWLEKDQDGYTVMVTVPDIGEQLEMDGFIEKRAGDLAFTRYKYDGCTHMLPVAFTKNHLSLHTENPTATITFVILLDQNARFKKLDIRKTKFCNKGRFSYEQVDRILGIPDHQKNPEFTQYQQLAMKLWQNRVSSGSIAFYDQNMGVICDEEGNISYYGLGKIARFIVQEFMILTNTVVAEYFDEKGVPFLFRNHCVINGVTQKLKLLREEKGRTQDRDLLGFLDDMRIIDKARPAYYDASNRKHFALNVVAYAHCTSPLRQYAALINNRIIRSWIEGTPSPYSFVDLACIANHINTTKTAFKKEQQQRFVHHATDQQLKDAGFSELLIIDKSRFCRFVELLCNGEIFLNNERAVAINLRHWKIGLTDSDFAILYFAQSPPTAVWKRVKKSIRQILAMSGSRVFNVIEAAARLKMIKKIKFKMDRYKRHTDKIYQVYSKVDFDGVPMRSETFLHASKHLAKKAAVFSLMGKITAYQSAHRVQFVKQNKKSEGALPGYWRKKPLKALTKWAQERNTDELCFRTINEFSLRGRTHYEVACEFNGHIWKGVSHNKKLAIKSVAKKICNEINEIRLS